MTHERLYRAWAGCAPASLYRVAWCSRGGLEGIGSTATPRDVAERVAAELTRTYPDALHWAVRVKGDEDA